MQLSEMKEIAENRKNVIAFLHISEIHAINENLVNFNCDKKSFSEICQATLEQYQSQTITNKQASIVFEILAKANKQFKTERYRYNPATEEISVYSKEQEGYLFFCYGSQRKLNKLIAENGKYI